MTIQKASRNELNDAARLAQLLWPGYDSDEMAPLLEDPEAAVFLCYSDGAAIGFAQCQLRHDYVEGCDTSPVGYLEGVYVVKDHRRQGVARALVTACQEWAREQGCQEFASDCELDNTGSLRFHLGVGFEEANRVICFIKRL